MLDALLLLAQAAGPPPRCGDRGEIGRSLSAVYGEVPVSLGLSTNGTVIEVFASVGGGSWTIVSTSPSGRGCIMATGKGWEAVPAGPAGEPS